MKKIFITGVDTDIGKTFVSLGLCLNLSNKKQKVGYFKPFQSGAYLSKGMKKAPDVETILKYCDIKSGYSYLLEGEVSPYLALKTSGLAADINKIKNDIDNFSKSLDTVIVEGAGGLYCPAMKDKLFSNIISELKIPAVIVTTPSLGRLNHTLMTLKCAKEAGIEVLGVIINKFPKNPTQSEINFIEELKDFSDVKILAKIPEVKELSKEALSEVFSGFDIL